MTNTRCCRDQLSWWQLRKAIALYSGLARLIAHTHMYRSSRGDNSSNNLTEEAVRQRIMMMMRFHKDRYYCDPDGCGHASTWFVSSLDIPRMILQQPYQVVCAGEDECTQHLLADWRGDGLMRGFVLSLQALYPTTTDHAGWMRELLLPSSSQESSLDYTAFMKKLADAARKRSKQMYTVSDQSSSVQYHLAAEGSSEKNLFDVIVALIQEELVQHGVCQFSDDLDVRGSFLLTRPQKKSFQGVHVDYPMAQFSRVRYELARRMRQEKALNEPLEEKQDEEAGTARNNDDGKSNVHDTKDDDDNNDEHDIERHPAYVKRYNQHVPYLGFMPVTPDGCYLQIWPDTRRFEDCCTRQGTILFLPMGTMLIMRGDMVHAGGIDSTLQCHDKAGGGGSGCPRVHLYIHNIPARRNQPQPQQDGPRGEGRAGRRHNCQQQQRQQRRESKRQKRNSSMTRSNDASQHDNPMLDLEPWLPPVTPSNDWFERHGMRTLGLAMYPDCWNQPNEVTS